MNNWSDPRLNERVGADTSYHGSVGIPDATYDEGLRQHMLKVYNYMTLGVALTGVVAYVVGNSSLINLFFTETGISALGFVAMFAPLAMVLVMNFMINRLSTPALQFCFWAFAAVMGVSISTIFLRYSDASIAQIFFVTAAAFAGLSIWGYTTKKDLSGWGTFLIMGVWGLVIAGLANFFIFKSGVMMMALSAMSVLIFAGLTAYDTQTIKSQYLVLRNTEFVGKAAIIGALELYLDFINMFLNLLRLFGSND